ncbi:MAG: hypothetical protein KA099_01380 [Alphaproteobacteria bacterium]|nr:hypothetical protein [Alphaproteobacteria bacterium]MBP7758684.1 hypothetical protein [Alphaproteobacteria bacterium]MBP7761712.1 hypothetical protein [Alphaproteobacteria bacterium]MBP7903953.1 hypothetical protein [Alphaproteobacteria bacterium]
MTQDTPAGRTLPNPEFIGKDLIEQLQGDYKKAGALSAAFKVHANLPAWSPVTSTYISDNGGYPDLAAGEIKVNLADIHAIVTTLSGQTPPQRVYHDIPSQDWRAGAFDLAQLSRYRLRGAGNTFFINCAPRLAQRGVEGNNKGEDVYAAMLPNGAVVSGVSPHSFAFFRDLVEKGDLEIYKVNVQTEGSQFRSRDFFPWYSELLTYNLSQAHEGWKDGLSVAERREFLQQFNFIDTELVLDLKRIPDLSKQPVVARADTHGNLKLSIAVSDAKPEWFGKRLNVVINGHSCEAEIREHMFDAKSGHHGIAPGSSGHFADSAKDDPRFLELAMIGKSLREELGITAQDLKDGVYIEIEPIEVLPEIHAGLDAAEAEVREVSAG